MGIVALWVRALHSESKDLGSDLNSRSNSINIDTAHF